MSPSNGSSLLTPKSNSTLRPRVRRLISVEDDIYATDESEGGPSRSASRKGSRNGSPMPASTSGISSSSGLNRVSNPISSFETSITPPPSTSSRAKSKGLSGILGNPWSAIQGIAANVIGGDNPSAGENTGSERALHGRHASTSAPPPKQWGPAGADSHIGAGTQEERETMVRAMKRKDLLIASDYMVSDSVGRIKRRNSDDRMSASAPPCENDDRDALVYVHHVQSRDTLAGLSIKYNCEHTVLRKSNRMWPNDSVQTKKVIVLPVDACGVKGRPVQGPEALPDEDLLLGEFGGTSDRGPAATNGLPNGWDAPKNKDVQPNPVPASYADSESPWKHDSWVLLPNDKKPTQIGRMPRRALGFFPPARRKSLAYSDASTPRASVDLTGSSISTNPGPSSPRGTRSRASSNLSSVSGRHHHRSASGKTWGLHGPGGVGTLGKNVRVPGPAQDGLNKNFAQYLPSMAPPPGQEYFTPWAPSLLGASTGTLSQHGGSGAITPLNGGGMDLQDIGGAIEGWVRKFGNQAQKLLIEPDAPGQGKRSAVPVLGAVGGDLGDLIELQDDPFEIGDDEHERGRSRTSEVLSLTTGPLSSRSSQQYQSARPDVSLILRERGKKGDGSKTD